MKFPYINIDSEDAKNVNSKIEKIYNELINKFEKNIEAVNQGKMTNDFATNYNTYINENILSIVIDVEYNERSLRNIGMSELDSKYYLGYYLNEDGKLNIIIYFSINADIGYRIDTLTVV